MTCYTASVYMQGNTSREIVAATPQQAAQKYRSIMGGARMQDVTVEVTAMRIENDFLLKETYLQTGDRRICRPI